MIYSADVQFPHADCTGGCLYDIFADETEDHDLSASMPARVAELLAALRAAEATAWQPRRGVVDPAVCQQQRAAYRGFYGPFANATLLPREL